MKHDFAWVTFGRLSAAIISLVSLRCATSLLSPAQYGEFALLIAVQLFSSLFIVNPVGQHVSRFAHAWWDEGSLWFRLRGFWLYVGAASLVSAVAILFLGAEATLRQPVLAAAVLFVMVLAANWNATLVAMLNMLGFRGSAVLWSTVTPLAGLAGSLMLVHFFQGALAWFAGQALGMVLGGVGAALVLRKESFARSSRRTGVLLDWASARSYCLPLAVATGLMWLQLSGWRFVMEHYWGLAMLGFVALGLSVAGQLWALAETMAMQFLYPLFFRRISQADAVTGSNAFSDLLNTLGPVYLVLAGATVLGAPSLLRVLVNPQYADAAIFVMFGAAIECCRTLGNVLGNAAQVTRRTAALGLPYAVGAALVFLLMWQAGVQGSGIRVACLALVAGAFGMMVVMVLSMRQQVPFSLDQWRWTSALLVLLVMVVTAQFVAVPASFRTAMAGLLLIAAFSMICLALLLWKNPALQSLLAVRLREEGGAA